MATIDELIQIVVQFRDERDWKQFHTPKELAIQLVLESAEVIELMQWRSGQELDEHLAENRELVADELSDVLHSVLLIAAEMKIDLAAAFKSKMAKNAVKYPVEKSRGSAQKYTQLDP
jgi:dCTP diphosphatase